MAVAFRFVATQHPSSRFPDAVRGSMVICCFCCEIHDGVRRAYLHCPSQPGGRAVASDGQAADRRHPHPGDHGARSAGASAARVSGNGHRRADDLRCAASHPSRAARGGRSPAGGCRPLLDSRLRRRNRLRDPARRAATRTGSRTDRRDAGLLREAAHDGRLEGTDQRSAPRRQLPHQRGSAACAAHPGRSERARVAGGHRVSRHDHAPVHRRPDRVGCDRRTHHGEPGAPRARLRAVVSGRVQERDRW